MARLREERMHTIVAEQAGIASSAPDNLWQYQSNNGSTRFARKSAAARPLVFQAVFCGWADWPIDHDRRLVPVAEATSADCAVLEFTEIGEQCGHPSRLFSHVGSSPSGQIKVAVHTCSPAVIWLIRTQGQVSIL